MTVVGGGCYTGRATGTYVTGFCPCRASNLDYCGHWVAHTWWATQQRALELREGGR